MNFPFLRQFFYGFLCFFLPYLCVHAQQNQQDQKAACNGVTPYYSEPCPGLLPKGYIQKGKIYPVPEVTVDTLGMPWFALPLKESKVWSPAKYWTYVSEIDTSAFAEGKQSEADKKRRLRILREHRGWPRRIIRSVRFGRICLDMTAEQLLASWDTPIQKNDAFTIGIGNHEIWLYNTHSGKYTAVLLKNDKVIGWSKK